ncbi:hypothetical protein HMN09_01315700 [Mycena chlorophos]|uniref:Uncharacterized protein n=2 Tax=Mycena chlorophos TaxID=658473 RepID=A0A146HTU2_MYCCL|nr:hypothetical protein HMN09_01315700 [Mycena chlorophos]GAT51515.1 predicted protein [Mycena chlorophos]
MSGTAASAAAAASASAAAALAAAAEEQAAILAAFNPNPTIGALLVGTLVSYVLFGITTVQVYLYYGRFPDDRLDLKGLVAFVWLVELAHLVSIGDATYTYAVTNYGNPLSLLGKIPVSLALSVVLSGLITTLVQGFFAYRIWTLASNKFVRLIPIALWISGIAYFMASFAGTVLAIESTNIPTFIDQYGWLLLAPWIMNLINDNSITISLVVLLLMSRTGFSKTTALVDQLIKWTIETGMITSVFSILNLVFYQKETNNFIWMGIQFVKARLFANSLLASLNSRKTLRAMSTGGAMSTESGGGFSSRTGATGGGGAYSYGGATANSGTGIAMTKVVFKNSDAETGVGGFDGYKSA